MKVPLPKWKTIIAMLVLMVAAVAVKMGWIGMETYAWLAGILVSTGLIALRHGVTTEMKALTKEIKKAEKKV